MFLLIHSDSVKKRTVSIKFTFHNVSINTNLLLLSWKECIHLHSTIFLLIPPSKIHHPFTPLYLHSTMFLLIQLPFSFLSIPASDLHSTMFLLIRQQPTPKQTPRKHLHSTMFLLIPRMDSPFEIYGEIYIPQCFY